MAYIAQFISSLYGMILIFGWNWIGSHPSLVKQKVWEKQQTNSFGKQAQLL